MYIYIYIYIYVSRFFKGDICIFSAFSATVTPTETSSPTRFSYAADSPGSTVAPTPGSSSATPWQSNMAMENIGKSHFFSIGKSTINGPFPIFNSFVK